MTFSWKDLRAHSEAEGGTGAGSQALLLSKPLLGAAWQKFYPDGDPSIEEVVPQQVVKALSTQLSLFRDQYETGGEMDTQAAQAFAAIKVGAKRYRTAAA